jgi:hypothetical protein
MKTINIYYWYPHLPSDFTDHYPHNQVFEGNLIEVITDIIYRGYEVMTRHIDENNVILFVNKFGQKFSQR